MRIPANGYYLLKSSIFVEKDISVLELVVFLRLRKKMKSHGWR